jgi:hypothetical protein
MRVYEKTRRSPWFYYFLEKYAREKANKRLMTDPGFLGAVSLFSEMPVEIAALE